MDTHGILYLWIIVYQFTWSNALFYYRSGNYLLLTSVDVIDNYEHLVKKCVYKNSETLTGSFNDILFKKLISSCFDYSKTEERIENWEHILAPSIICLIHARF